MTTVGHAKVMPLRQTAPGPAMWRLGLERNGYVSDILQKKPKGRPMSEATSRANGRRSKIRAFVEHVFARQKAQMKLFIRTIGIARATTKIGMTNLTYNLMRFVWHEGRSASA